MQAPPSAVAITTKSVANSRECGTKGLTEELLYHKSTGVQPQRFQGGAERRKVADGARRATCRGMKSGAARHALRNRRAMREPT
jgi:hypothetical protein